ncbi:MAG: GNAT family N-acetyltransferase [Planctomycetota bacterium]
MQHVSFEGPAGIADWADARQYPLEVRYVHRDDNLPTLEEFDFLILLGGRIDANDGLEHAWIEAEIDLIDAATMADKPVLGICLGAQLIARSLGAKVYPAAQPEIGWLPVRRCHTHEEVWLTWPDTFTPLHWHGDTFDLPRGATRLAESDICATQAFRYGDRVIGLQFHLEATPASVAELIEHAGDMIVPGPTQQRPERILDNRSDIGGVQPILFDLLDGLASLSMPNEQWSAGGVPIVTGATRADLPDLARLVEIRVRRDFETTGHSVDHLPGLTELIDHARGATLLVARWNGRPVGLVVLLQHASTRGGRLAFIENLVVRPEVRCRGVGRLLLQSAAKMALTGGCRQISVVVDEKNDAVQKFFAEHAFSLSPSVPMRLEFPRSEPPEA